jgi:hypothetical protein
MAVGILKNKQKQKEKIPIMLKIKNKRYIFAALVLVMSFMLPDLASATQLTQAGIRLGRLGNGASANNDMLVTFKLLTTPTSVAKILVTVPSGFNLAAGSPTPVTTNLPNTPAEVPAPGTLASTVTSSGSNLGGTILVTGLTSASLNGTSLFAFDIPTGTITNPTTLGQYNFTVASQNAGGTTLDSTLVATYIYGASANQDQVVVNASVAPNFTFALSANTDTVPKVDPTTIQTSPGVTMTVGTNSPLGYTAYVASKNNSLTSATNPATPITTGTFDGTPDTVTAGTTKYTFVPTTGTACSSCTGTLTYNSEYAIADGTHGGSFSGTNSFASFVSRNGYTNSDQITLKERVAVASTIGYANDYTDTLTIVAAGNY